MRRYIIAGNWKMNNGIKEALELVNGLKRELVDINNVDIIVAPVFTVLGEVADTLTHSNIKVSAQNLFWEEKGAFTGEVSPQMIKETGCEYVIIGHSERRQYFGETNEAVNKKIKAALGAELTPIVCVGEKLEEREAGKTFDVIKSHVLGALNGYSKEELLKCVLAYEPVWAIGTGKTATGEQAQEVHKYIRDLLKENFGEEVAANIRIQYGGSVKPDNIEELIQKQDIDGALGGGASVKVDSFSQIVKKASQKQG